MYLWEWISNCTTSNSRVHRWKVSFPWQKCHCGITLYLQDVQKWTVLFSIPRGTHICSPIIMWSEHKNEKKHWQRPWKGPKVSGLCLWLRNKLRPIYKSTNSFTAKIYLSAKCPSAPFEFAKSSLKCAGIYLVFDLFTFHSAATSLIMASCDGHSPGY